ncbi:hypothetical protein ADIAL_1406 [Alkalibacterium sp. AK22]|nr:hypothetical protein ADIAL_1406 [Alkalibacterium sp. AK22]
MKSRMARVSYLLVNQESSEREALFFWYVSLEAIFGERRKSSL